MNWSKIHRLGWFNLIGSCSRRTRKRHHGLSRKRGRGAVTLSGGDGPFAGDGDAMHEAALAVIVVDGVMHRAAVVPDGERTLGPAEAAGEFRRLAMLVEEVRSGR